MDIDHATLYDLNIFARHEQDSLFDRLNFARTSGGKAQTRYYFQRPLNDVRSINKVQEVLKRFIDILPKTTETISNGTLMVLDRYFDTPVGTIPHPATALNACFYKLFNKADYSTVRYSVKHIVDFIKGMQEFAEILSGEDNPELLENLLQEIRHQLEKPFARNMLRFSKEHSLTTKENIAAGRQIYQNKSGILSLEELFFKIDAWYSMAKAMIEYNFHFPEITESDIPLIEATGLYHPLLENPVGNDFSLAENNNFLFLTGANMAGKSTFIRAVGIAVYMASLGMGVPADTMQMSAFEGILSNIEVTDNTLQGESYFFNEVKRIKTTVDKIKNGKKWLILIDELFKGTNIQDAMKCSTAVVEGLVKVPTSLFVLSTHLYEIGEDLKKYPNLQFRYFETEAVGDSLIFSYRLKIGISNDRLGYLILRREKVVDMLNEL